MSTKSTALMCPGQGSQYPGMNKDLLEHFAWTKELYEEGSDATGVDYRKLCADGPADQLTLTENGQPSILITSYAWFQVLRRELDFAPAAGAGHSLGEYSALLCAGAMTLSEAVPLVKERGRLMQSAVPVGVGKMAAVLGLDPEKVQTLCEKASTGPDSQVVPVNYNSAQQVVVAGHATAVDRAGEIASDKSSGLRARRYVPLEVSAPFHSPLMQPVVEPFSKALGAVNWQELKFDIAFNVDATIRSEANVIELLQKQIDHPVYWSDSVVKLHEAGHERFVEMGPGNVLCGLLKRTVKGAESFAVDSIDGFRAFEKAHKENA